MIETVAGMTELQIKLFTAVGQILVAIAVGVIALRQWLTARNKLKADLFDKRIAALTEIEDPLIEILGGKTDRALAIRIQRGERRFKYLFSAAAQQAANDIGQDVSTLVMVTEQLQSDVFYVGRQAHAQRSNELTASLGKQLFKLHDLCRPELTLRE